MSVTAVLIAAAAAASLAIFARSLTKSSVEPVVVIAFGTSSSVSVSYVYSSSSGVCGGACGDVVLRFLLLDVGVGEADDDELDCLRLCLLCFFALVALDFFFFRFLDGDGDGLRLICCLLLVTVEVRHKRAAVSCCFLSWSSLVCCLQVM